MFVLKQIRTNSEAQTSYLQLVRLVVVYGAVIGGRGVFNFYRLPCRKNGPATVYHSARVYHPGRCRATDLFLRFTATAIIYRLQRPNRARD
jgi:hypothetical protein